MKPTATLNPTEELEWINEILLQGGPEPHQYDGLSTCFEQIANHLRAGSQDALAAVQRIVNAPLLKDETSVLGHCRVKPYGYAGDFSIIDRIYTHDKSDKYAKWDDYALSTTAAQAVRNRKVYFKQCAHERMRDGGQLLNVASGPARDLKELYESGDYTALHTTCVEMDPKAIAHAESLNRAYSDQITFVNKNIFRFRPDQKFDWIWSAGLFDYFDDKAFVLLLKWFKTWLKPGGEIIIGNFNEAYNPARSLMELVGDWHLIHRSESSLIQLAMNAGFSMSQIQVGKEELGVNLFLHLQS